MPIFRQKLVSIIALLALVPMGGAAYALEQNGSTEVIVENKQAQEVQNFQKMETGLGVQQPVQEAAGKTADEELSQPLTEDVNQAIIGDQQDISPDPSVKQGTDVHLQSPVEGAGQANRPKLESDLNKGDPNGAKAAFNQALADYRAGLIDRAIPALELSARRGAFLAKFLLAHIYEMGRGVPIDVVKAFDFHNQVISQYNLEDGYFSNKALYAAKSYVAIGKYVERGISQIDLKPNPSMARQNYEKAAHIGEREGQFLLGRLLLQNTKGKANHRLGLRWVFHSAKKNYAPAQTFLAESYWRGNFIERNPSMALAWLDFAQRNAVGDITDKVIVLQEEMSSLISPKLLIKSQTLVNHMRKRYNLLWRETPIEDDEAEKFFEGIISAIPPNGFDLHDVPNQAFMTDIQEQQRLGKDSFSPAQLLLGHDREGASFFDGGFFNFKKEKTAKDIKPENFKETPALNK